MISLLFMALATADEPGTMTRDEFFKAYDAAIEKVENFYRRVKIRCSLSSVRAAKAGKEEPPPQKTLLEFASAGKYFRLIDVEKVDAEGFVEPKTMVMVVRPDDCFTLRRKAATDPFTVSERLDDKVRVGLALNSMRGYCPVGFAPYSTWWNEPLHRALRNKDYTFRSIRTNVGSDRLTEVRVAPSPTFPKEELYFRFSPRQGWVVREADLVTTSGFARRIRIDYEGEKDGVPLIKRVETWTDDPQRSVQSPRRVYDVVSIEPADAPASLFRTKTYGIDEVVSGRRWETWFASGIGLLGVGVGLQWLIRGWPGGGVACPSRPAGAASPSSFPTA